MTKIKLITIISLVLLLGCTKTVEKIIYPEGNPDSTTGTIVGLVIQKESNAKVIVRQATPIDSTIVSAEDGSFRIECLPTGNYDLYVTAQNFGTYWIRNVMVNAGGVTYVGEISLSSIPDLVSSHYPEDRAEVVFNRRWSRLSVSISFNEPMNRESVEAAFSTDPPTEGTFYWDTYSQAPIPIYFETDYLRTNWDKASNLSAEITTYKRINSFTYHIARKDCYSDTTYRVMLSTMAKDTTGNSLDFPLQFSFSTVQSAYTQNAILTYPEHGDIYVDPLENSSIYISFPRRMNQSSVENSLTIIPSTDPIFVWPEENKLRIYTGGPLQCEILYQLTIREAALDLDGVPLGEKFEFSFETAPVEVESTSPGKGEIFVSRNSKISMVFNTYMILSSVQAAFSIEPGIHGTFVRGWGYDNDYSPAKDVITFKPSTNFASNTKYIVTIGTRSYDLHGTNLKEAYTFAFVTEPE